MPRGVRQNVNWLEVKAAFLNGDKPVEIAKRFNITVQSIYNKSYSEGWAKKVKELSLKVEESFEKRLLPLASSFRESQYNRAIKWQQIIDASATQGATNNDGVPLVDSDDIDRYTKAETRLHQIGFSSLGLSERSQVDVTSGGKPLANLGEAVALVQAMVVERGLVPLTDQEVLELQQEPIEGEEIPPSAT